MRIRQIDISEIEGFRLGNAENIDGGTGCTVIISEDGAVGGVDVRGGGPATRETDLLRSENTVEKINAVVLSGGSAFGLEAGSGVMRALSARNVGFDVGGIKVPIVAGASLFDLAVGEASVFPDREMGMEAVNNAYSGIFESGNHGAGTGASCGKILGMDRAMKTGLGTYACGDELIKVGAVVAVNAVADVYNGAGNIIAGLRSEDGSTIYGTIKVLKDMLHPSEETVKPSEGPELDFEELKSSPSNDTPVVNPFVSTPASSEQDTGNQTPDVPEKSKNDIARAIQEAYERASIVAVQEPSEVQGVSEATETVTEPETSTEGTAVIDFVESPAEAPAVDKEFYNETPEIPAEVAQEEPVVQETPEVPVEMAESEDRKKTAESAPVMEPTSEVPTSEGAYVHDEPAEISHEEPVTETCAQEEPVSEPDPYELSQEEKDDMGYDIPFNTTIGCLITNARFTKAQANKLASILHDAYARAIKPVHSTLDGDTIFVLSTCTEPVNFDAFAALATDVMQYAIIDAALKAEGAYGLPSAKDIARK